MIITLSPLLEVPTTLKFITTCTQIYLLRSRATSWEHFSCFSKWVKRD